MPKKPSTQSTAPRLAEPESSIDDIFASKPKKLPKTPAQASINAVASSSKSTSSAVAAPSSTAEPPKKKKKKSKGGSIPGDDGAGPKASTIKGDEPGSQRVVQEVLDPSIPRPSEEVKVPKVVNAKEGGSALSTKPVKKKRKEQADDDELFADSRGTGPSTSYISPV